MTFDPPERKIRSKVIIIMLRTAVNVIFCMSD